MENDAAGGRKTGQGLCSHLWQDGAQGSGWPWGWKDTGRFESDLDLWTVRGRGRSQDVMLQFQLGPLLDAGDFPREAAPGEQQRAGRVMCECEGQ